MAFFKLLMTAFIISTLFTGCFGKFKPKHHNNKNNKHKKNNNKNNNKNKDKFSSVESLLILPKLV